MGFKNWYGGRITPNKLAEDDQNKKIFDGRLAKRASIFQRLLLKER